MEKTSLNKGEILERNPKVDSSLVSSFDKLEEELKSFGVKTKSVYGLNPPLKECRIKPSASKDGFYIVHFK